MAGKQKKVNINVSGNLLNTDKFVESLESLTLDKIKYYIFNAGSDHVQTFGGAFEGGIQIQQIPDEIAPCIFEIIKSGKEIESYLEIGSAAGGTAFLFDHFFKPKNIILIDDNKHPKAHVRPYILKDINHREIIGQSCALGTLAAVNELNIKFDIIMIDGGHDYFTVKQDSEIYKDLLKEGGFLILHDSALPEWGIKRVVSELKNYDDLEFIDEYITETKIRPCGVALFQKLDRE